MIIDTVKQSKREADKEQPWAALGLKENEYDSIRQILGRRPTSSELAMYSVMWSEHCSYKSSKVHLKQFGDKAVKTDALLVGIGENAGVVDVGQGTILDRVDLGLRVVDEPIDFGEYLRLRPRGI